MRAREETLIEDLTTGDVSRTLIVFSVPLMLANILQVLYNLVDMVVVGRFVGSAGLSAVSNGGDILTLATVLCIGFSSAGQILISQYVGARDPEGIRKTIGTMCSFLAIVSVVLMVLGFATIDPLLTGMNVPPEAYAGAKAYSVVCFCGLIFIFGYNAFSAILRGMGDSKRPFLFIAAATIINLVLNLVFVGGLGMGVGGSALATVIGQGTSCVGSVAYLYIKRQAFGFDFKPRSFAIDRATLTPLLKLGVPMALQSVAIIISKLFVNSWINSYGLIVSAVTGIGARICLVASIVTAALGAAGSSMIGQSFGAGILDRIRRITYISFGWGIVVTVPLSALAILFPEHIFRLFSTDANVLAMSHEYAIVIVLNLISFALRSPMMALINGLGNGTLAMTVGILDGVVARVGLAMLLGATMGMGFMGFWYGNAVAGYVPFLIGGIYFWSGMWKYRKLAIREC